MPRYTATYVYPVSSPPIANGIVETAEDGSILGVHHPTKESLAGELIHVDGILTPGFINTHCHLELSHLAGRSQTGKTLLPFLVDVVTMRENDPATIEAAITRQDRLMWEAGIQAVGDICNRLDTAAVKRDSPVRYYSFVEMFDFLQPATAEKNFAQYRAVYKKQGGAKSAVPHAPYTVSDPLYRRINGLNVGQETVSIHNQETPAEDELFLTGGGPFVEFFRGFGATLEDFSAPGTTSIRYAMQRMDPSKRTLFVHNTLTTEVDIAAAQAWGENGVYWATCPNANLYIENRLPRYDRFLNQDAKVTIGTDSLTSNWQLSVLEELKTIAKYQSYVPFAALLRWATLNGAEALQFDDLGSLEEGKKPGLLALYHLGGSTPDDHHFRPETTVKRLV